MHVNSQCRCGFFGNIRNQFEEIPDFDLNRAIQNGMIPRHYMVANARKRLQGYIDLYLTEEISEEAAVQNLDDFVRFMEVAAISDGEIMNYENVASDCGVSANTVKAYYKILVYIVQMPFRL